MDFLKSLRKKTNDFQNKHQREINMMKRESKKVFETAKQKSMGLEEKLRVEKNYMEQKYRNVMKNQNYDNLHRKWLGFRENYLSSAATSVLQKLTNFGMSSKKVVQNINVDEKIEYASRKLGEKGIDSSKLT